MHAITIIDTPHENMESTVAFITREREGRIGDREFLWNIKAREIRVFDLCFPEEFEEEVIKEINSFSNYRLRGLSKSTLFSAIKRLLRIRPPVDVREDRTKNHLLFKQMFPAERMRYFYAQILGIMEDRKGERGEELL